jgi:hypothetical protein
MKSYRGIKNKISDNSKLLPITTSVNDERVDILISKIELIKQNSDYRVSDIINKSGCRWEHSGDQVLNSGKYEGTILHEYLKTNGLYADKNLPLLFNIIKDYTSKHNLELPDNNTLVVHLRLGDMCEIPSKFLVRKYKDDIIMIIKSRPNINNIKIVTCFQYGEWSKESLHIKPEGTPLWNYTEKKHEKNIKALKKVFNDILANINLPIDIISNTIIDHDFCYCVLSDNFMMDTGGFSRLLYDLNNINKQSVIIQCSPPHTGSTVLVNILYGLIAFNKDVIYSNIDNMLKK